MAVIDEFARVKDKHNLISSYMDGRTTGNGIRYSAEYLYILKKHSIISSREVSRTLDAVRSCMVFPGLYNRTPDGAFGQQGPDDYAALGLISHQYDVSIARDILAYGRGQFPPYVYKNDPKGKWGSAFLGRQQQLVCHWQWAAGEKPPLWRRVWWGIAILLAAFSKKQDSKMLSWALVVVGKGRGWVTDRVISFWRKKFKKHYPRGAGQVMAEYIGDDSHPLAKYLLDDFGGV